MDLKLALMVLISHLASAFFSRTIAGQKARNSKNWFIAGLIFGPLGLIASVGLADRHQIVYLRYWLSTTVMNRGTAAEARREVSRIESSCSTGQLAEAACGLTQRKAMSR